MQKVFYVSVLSLFLLAGCSSEQLDLKKSISVNGAKDWIAPYSFNWEDPNLNWMPYPSGDNVARIPLPWNGQGSLSSTVDPDVLNDRKASDGWVLLYSTFSPVTLSWNPYFILYNKYRGLMRVFLYVNNSSFGSSSYLKNAITQPTNQYSILNFAGSEIVDVSQNQTKVTKIEPAPLDGSAPFATFKWYMLQYELAYDPTITATNSANPPQLSFNINSVDITQVNLGGTATGTLKGTLGATGPTDIFSSLTSSISPLGKGIIAAVGNSALSRYKTDEDTNSMGLDNTTFKAISSGLTSLISTAAGSIPGTVYNVLSAIVGGSSGGGGQTVSLNLKADISLAGTMTNNTGLPSTPASVYFPGSLLADANGNYNVQGFVPLYNNTLGVFNITAKPTVTLNYNCYNLGSTGINQIYQYRVVNNSYSIQWNPAVLSIATISNLSTEVVVSTGTNDITSYLIGKSGRTETLQGTPNWWIGGNGSFDAVFRTPNTTPRVRFYDNQVYVRISFVVHPNNGAPDVAIVKTFKANKQIINDTQINY